MLPTRVPPVRVVKETSSRISQSAEMERLLPTIKTKLFTPHLDKLVFGARDPFDVTIRMYKNSPATFDKGVPDVAVLYPDQTKPTIFFIRIEHAESSEGHALLGIMFPEEHMIDIVSTYSIDIDSMNAIQHILSHTVADFPILNDVSCLSVKPIKLRTGSCYNLQSEDTAEIGWCVSWMVKLAQELVSKSKEEFWSQKWAARRLVYKTVYDKYVNLPGFNSMEVGKENWNSILALYNAGGKRKLRKTRRKTRRVKNQKALNLTHSRRTLHN